MGNFWGKQRTALKTKTRSTSYIPRPPSLALRKGTDHSARVDHTCCFQAHYIILPSSWSVSVCDFPRGNFAREVHRRIYRADTSHRWLFMRLLVGAVKGKATQQKYKQRTPAPTANTSITPLSIFLLLSRPPTAVRTQSGQKLDTSFLIPVS